MKGKLVESGKVVFEGWVPPTYFTDIESYNYVPLWPSPPKLLVGKAWVHVTFTVERTPEKEG